MKKLNYIFLLILLIFVTGCSSETGSDKTEDIDEGGGNEVKFILGSWFPPADPMAEAVSEWEEIVYEKTNGEVVVESFHGSQLGQAHTLLPDVQGGVYDLGWVSPILFDDTEMFPYTIANLPFALPDPESGARIMQKFYEKYNEISSVKPLGITVSDPYVLISKEPIYSIEDVKGKRIRAESAALIELTKNWGATPVTVPLTDIYEALEKGTLDVAIMAVTGGTGYNLFEAAPYVTHIPISTISLIPSINIDSFNKMSDPSKKLFEEELGPLFADMFTQDTVSKIENIIEGVEEGEGEFITLSDEELQPFLTGAKDVWESWVQEANKKGYPGEEMMEDFKRFIEEEGHSLPFE